MFLSLWFAAVLWASQPVADLLQQADDAHDLGKFAEKTLPTVEEHYQMAKELNAKIGK